jgi:hypothetical protein
MIDDGKIALDINVELPRPRERGFQAGWHLHRGPSGDTQAVYS